jgi:hypothetical protein
MCSWKVNLMEILVIHSLANLVSNIINMSNIFHDSKFDRDISNSFACKSC